MRTAAAVAVISILWTFASPRPARADFGPAPAPNPSVGTHGGATMHGDTLSSDTTTLPGPGVGSLSSAYKPLFGACPTVLLRRDGTLWVLCTAWAGRQPTIRLLDDRLSKLPLATLKLPAGSLLGGVYAYVDSQDRLVMVDGEQNLVRVKAVGKRRLVRTTWTLTVDESVPLVGPVTNHCGGGGCDAVVSISPDGSGAVWFATRGGAVGIHDPETGRIERLLLPRGESIHNSFSTTNDGRAAVATDHALYLLDKDRAGRPVVRWRRAYDRGTSRKPGQLSHGTGATPTFFGGASATAFVTITDNASEGLNLLVFAASSDDGVAEGELVCVVELFDRGSAGTENSAIAVGNSIVVASTYGYPYPEVPEGAGPAVPESAPFVGGMARVDLRPDRSGCDPVWRNSVRSAAVPKLSLADQLIYTIERRRAFDQREGAVDSYHFTAVDPYSGAVLRQTRIGGTVFRNPLQMAGNIGSNGVYWQGTLGGVMRISP